MSSGGQGGTPTLKLKQKSIPTYPGDAIKSERQANFSGSPTTLPTKLKLGIRVKQGQIPTLVLRKHAVSIPQSPILLTPLPDTSPVIADLAAALGCDPTSEKWFAFTFDWSPALGVEFDSSLTLTPFKEPFVTKNGFQIVTVVFCHNDTTFEHGSYSYAISVLPGKDSSGFPISFPNASSTTTTAKKTAKKAPKKAAKKPKAKSKKKSRR